MSPNFSYDAIADRLVDLAVQEGRIRALWVEADALRELRRPYAKLEVHLAADEPQFPGLIADLEKLLGGVLRVENRGVREAQRFARQFDLRLSEKGAAAPGLPLALIVEQTSLLAKRPRAHVVPLVDKTCHLTHVMDFSRRR
jgi:hypothetical protein